MKGKRLLTLGAALLLLASCGPKVHRYNCGSKRRCISEKEINQPVQKPQSIKKAAC